MKTFVTKPADVQRTWYVVDASEKVLGRLAVEVACILRGKNKPEFQPNVDTGDYVIVVNADKIKLTGDKWNQKTYYRYSGYMGGMKSTIARKLILEKPERMIRLAVWGMLPKNRLGRKLIKKLKVYTGSEHPHEAQQPATFKLIEKYS